MSKRLRHPPQLPESGSLMPADAIGKACAMSKLRKIDHQASLLEWQATCIYVIMFQR